jgi:hypothetical protein
MAESTSRLRFFSPDGRESLRVRAAAAVAAG